MVKKHFGNFEIYAFKRQVRPSDLKILKTVHYAQCQTAVNC